MADPPTVSRLVRVSGPSPYATCTAGGSGTSYVNSEVEPFVTVNPGNSANLIGVWQQDRWSNGSARGIVGGYSLDGGITWHEVPLPFSSCAAGGLNYGRATDPWVSMGADGTAYAIALCTRPGSAIAAMTSQDGGADWNTLNILKSDPSGVGRFNDKPSVTADPTRTATAYVVWDRTQRTASSTLLTGPTWFSRTTDGGRAWSTARIIFSPGNRNYTIGNQIVVDPRTGRLYNFFNWVVASGTTRGRNIAVQTSDNSGRTWSGATIVAKQRYVGVTDPNTGVKIRTGIVNPVPAIDASGNLYVVWQDSRFSGGRYNEIALSRSTNRGASWSTPVRVNPATGKPTFTPAIRVNAAGVIGVTYYDFRDLTSETASLPTDCWINLSRDGGRSFDSEAHVAGPFDLLTAPETTSGHFLGDYQGLTTTGDVFHPFFVEVNSGNTANRTDVYTAAVTP